MPFCSKIHFSLSTIPITEAVTKFGGQPSWLEAPQWPLSRTTGKPMRFICQIALDDALFPQAAGKVAYIFMTDEDEYVDGTWDPNGGENSVIIQPGGKTDAGTSGIPSATPSLYDLVDQPGASTLVAQEREYAVRLSKTSEPAFVEQDQRSNWTEEQFAEYAQALEGNKVGGSPIFLQGDEFPEGGNWSLLLQLDSTAVPFSVNFGDAGIAYVFVDSTGTMGKFLWQCG